MFVNTRSIQHRGAPSFLVMVYLGFSINCNAMPLTWLKMQFMHLNVLRHSVYPGLSWDALFALMTQLIHVRAQTIPHSQTCSTNTDNSNMIYVVAASKVMHLAPTSITNYETGIICSAAATNPFLHQLIHVWAKKVSIFADMQSQHIGNLSIVAA